MASPLIVIDEVGYIPIDADAANLFHDADAVHERRIGGSGWQAHGDHPACMLSDH